MDASGTAVASYAYDTWGAVSSTTEAFANGWHNPYLYDDKDGIRYDQETGLSWMAVRAYDPTLGRFISRTVWEGSTEGALHTSRDVWETGL